MNLLILMSTLLLGNRTTDVNVQVEQHISQLSEPSESFWQPATEEFQYLKQWQEYKNTYDKYYESNEEEYKRMKIYIENSKFIEDHNSLYNRGLSSFSLGHNQFSDLTHKEYLDQYTTYTESSQEYEINDKPTVLNNPTVHDKPTVRNGPTVHDEAPTVRNDAPTVKYDAPTVRNDAPTVRCDAPTVRNDAASVRFDAPTVRNQEPSVEEHEPTVRYENSYDLPENSYGISKDINFIEYMPPANVEMPYTVDWRRKGAVTPVKDQGSCRASWLFSTTGALEGQVFRKIRHLTPLSEQNILDCSDRYGNDGCNNGTAINSFHYIFWNHGINTNQSYPWYGKKSWFCHYKNYPSNPTIRTLAVLQSGNETALSSAVATVGPVSTVIDGSSRWFRFYKHGIYQDPHCSKVRLNQHMLVVGYGSTYWIVKNSFGRSWGAGGYIYMARNKNQCGIATMALYPII